MSRATRITLLAVIALTLAGCVERRFYITSDPPGALVRLNGVEVGVTPVEVDFTFYGKYDVQLEKAGYEPLTTTADAKSPLYDKPGFDFFAEISPARFKSDIRWHFTLEPENDDPDAVVERARSMRGQVFESTTTIEPGKKPD
jgi:PEGA domain